jgi:CMP-N-acetylneuraminic acid synthetase
MKTLAIIPARGGSKGIPQKNIRNLVGKPLIQYAIDAALESQRLERIVVSSDDDQILDIAIRQGITVHKRESEISGDESPVSQTVAVVLKEVERITEIDYDAFMLLQPTAPIRTGYDIDRAIDILSNNPRANSVISVCPMDDIHPARMYTIDESNYLSSFMSEYENMRRQEIPPAYYRNGCIYLVRKKAFFESGSLMNKPSLPYIMDRKYLCNIDDPRDLIIADALIQAWQNGKL